MVHNHASYSQWPTYVRLRRISTSVHPNEATQPAGQTTPRLEPGLLPAKSYLICCTNPKAQIQEYVLQFIQFRYKQKQVYIDNPKHNLIHYKQFWQMLPGFIQEYTLEFALCCQRPASKYKVWNAKKLRGILLHWGRRKKWCKPHVGCPPVILSYARGRIQWVNRAGNDLHNHSDMNTKYANTENTNVNTEPTNSRHSEVFVQCHVAAKWVKGQGGYAQSLWKTTQTSGAAIYTIHNDTAFRLLNGRCHTHGGGIYTKRVRDSAISFSVSFGPCEGWPHAILIHFIACCQVFCISYYFFVFEY